MGSDGDGVNMSKEDDGVQMLEVRYMNPGSSQDTRILWNGDHFEFSIDEMGLEVDGDRVFLFNGDVRQEVELDGFMNSDNRPTCPNYYCENYAADCEKHDEKGNTL